MAKPESTFIASVHRKLSPKPWAEKNHNAYRGGTPDVFYSGLSGCLWIEYKWITIPVRALIEPALSPLQRDWLYCRYHEGRNVAVIIGCPEGGVLLRTPAAWNRSKTPEYFRRLLRSREQLAQYIIQAVGARCVTSSRPFSTQRTP